MLQSGRLLPVYDRLLRHFGHQDWWPGDSPLEIMVGAVLTQNAAWTNVEKAIVNLKQADSLDLSRLCEMEADALAGLIRPAGYFNVKAARLQNLLRWTQKQGGVDGLSRMDTHALRRGLLGVNGVGPETADDILLYAFERPVFVVDAYTRRMLSRLGVMQGKPDYELLRSGIESGLVEEGLSEDERTAVFNEYHALIVMLCKDFCRSRPLCGKCPLGESCSYPEG